jgi:hypothetical protein
MAFKADTTKTMRGPGFNSIGTHGRWAFTEFCDAYAIEKTLGDLMQIALAASGIAS